MLKLTKLFFLTFKEHSSFILQNIPYYDLLDYFPKFIFMLSIFSLNIIYVISVLSASHWKVHDANTSISLSVKKLEILNQTIQPQFPALYLHVAHILKSCIRNPKLTIMMVPLCIHSTEIQYAHSIIHLWMDGSFMKWWKSFFIN